MSETRVAHLVSPSGLVRATPPPPGQRYWRIGIYGPDGHRIQQASGGRTRESAQRRVADLERALAPHQPAGAIATHGEHLLDFFLDDSRPKYQAHSAQHARWSLSYTDQIHHLVDHYLRPVLNDVPLHAWASQHAFAVLDACPTNYMVTKVRRALSSVLSVGVADGFLRGDQRDLHRVTVPLRPETRPARQPRPRETDLATLLRPDEVPSLRQVAALAAACPSGTDPVDWAGTVNLLAYAGLRIGELFAISCDDVLDPALPAGLLAVRWQVVESGSGPKTLAPPKNGFARLAAVCETSPLGFPLRAWLIDRARTASAERAAGVNPGGTLIASPCGQWWSRTNFRSRRFNPAATAAGWERVTWEKPVVSPRGRVDVVTRQDWRHTPHSLRHHYACTARDVWGWTGAELCLNGGWADQAFVCNKYYGTSEDSYRTALRKQRDVPRDVRRDTRDTRGAA